jgi:hypothetical protein
MKDKNKDDENLFLELEAIGEAIEIENEILEASEKSFVELKQEEFNPIYDEYYNSKVVGKFVFVDIEEKSASGKKLKDPRGGLTAAGRAHFKKTEGANLKPGVRGPANTPEKMRRKGSFLTRFFTNPSGPMKDKKGRATRLALSASAWGEPVPGDAEAAARLAAKGRRLLERYAKTKKKELESFENIQSKEVNEIFSKALGQSIGQMAGAKPSADEAIDHDMDGMIFDGTPQEQRKPYKKGSDSWGREQGMDYEKRRRAFVRQELARQGIKRRRGPQRTEAERLARTRARARFDAEFFDRAERERQERMRPAKPDNSWQRAEDARNARKKPPLGPPAPKPLGPPAPKRTDNSSQRAEDARNARKKPPLGPPAPKPLGPPAPKRTDNSSQRAEDARNARKKPRLVI